MDCTDRTQIYQNYMPYVFINLYLATKTRRGSYICI